MKGCACEDSCLKGALSPTAPRVPDFHPQVLSTITETKYPGEDADDKAGNMGVFLDGPLGVLGNHNRKSEAYPALRNFSPEKESLLCLGPAPAGL